MKKQLSRVFALLLALCMVCSLLPVTASPARAAAVQPMADDCTLTLEVKPEKGGTLTVAKSTAPYTQYQIGTNTIAQGTEISLNFQAAEGYVFEKFLLNDEDVVDEIHTERWDPSTYYYTVNQDSKITAVFKSTAEPANSKVTFTVDPENAGSYTYSSYADTSDTTVSKSTEVDIPDGTEVTLKNAKSNDSYTFKNWVVNSGGKEQTLEPDTAGTATFTVNGETTVKGVFESVPAEQGSVVTFKIEPEGGGTFQYEYTTDNRTVGTVTDETQVTVPLNTYITLYTPKANENYEFVELQVDGVRQQSGFAGYGFYTSKSTHTVTAVFKGTSTECTITKQVLPNEEAGSFVIRSTNWWETEEVTGPVDPGTQVYLEAKANDGYRFVKFQANGTDLQTEGFNPLMSRTYEIDTNVIFTATFESTTPDKEKYTIALSANPEEGGEVSGDGEYDKGETVTIEAEPNENYTFVNWTKDGEEFSNEAKHTFEASENLNLVANFQKNDAEPALVFDIEPEGAGSYTYYYFDGMNHEQRTKVDKRIELQEQPDDQIIVENPEPADGFQFVEWDVNGNRYKNGPWGYTVNLTGAPTTIKAIFEKTSTDCKITTKILPGEEAGSLKLTDFNNFSQVITDTVAPGTKVSLEAQPNSGYTFVEFLVDGQSGKVDMEHWPGATIGSYTVTSDVTFTVVFQKDGETYTISLSAKPTEGGKVSGDGEYAEGDSVTIKAEANDGYTFVNWTNGEDEFSKQAEYTFDATEDLTLVANFEKESTDPVVTLDMDPPKAGTFGYNYFDKRPYSGTVSEKMTLTLTPGLDFTVDNPVPADGYEFVEWDIDGSREPNGYWGKTVNITKDTKITAIFKPTTQTEQYTVTVEADPKEGGTVTGGGTFDKGTSVTVTAAPNPGYKFDHWTIEGETGIRYPLSYTFNLEKDMKLTAHFSLLSEQVKYKVKFSVSPEETGNYSYYLNGRDSNAVQVTAETEIEVDPDTTVGLIAYGGGDYTLQHWLINDEQQPGDEKFGTRTYSFTVTGDTTVVGVFAETVKPEGFTLTKRAEPQAGGTVTASPEPKENGKYDSGTRVVLTATANPGYTFTGWEDGNGSALEPDSRETPNQITVVISGDMTVVARFTPDETQTFHISLSVDPSEPAYGTAFIKDTAMTEGDFAAGTEITVLAIPVHEGATFVGWKEKDGTDYLSHELEYSFTVERDLDLVACFTDTTIYYLTFAVTPEDGGYLARTPETVKDDSGNEGYPYYANQEVLISGIAWSGYRFDHFLLDGERVPDDQVKLDATGNPTYTLTVTKNHHVEAVFTPLPTYTLTLVGQPTGHCTAIAQVGSVMERYPAGTWVNIKANVDEGYTFLGWYDAFGNPFMVPNSSGELVHLKTIAGVFQITKDTVLVAVAVKDGQENFTVEATPSYEKGGSVSVTPEGTFKDGDKATVKATPNAGYRFLGWSEGGAIVNTDETYTFTVHTDRTLVALFKLENPRTLTIGVSANPAAGGFVTGGGEYEEETMATVVAQANAGYYFVRWEENGKSVSEDARYTFLVTEDRDLVAVFAKEATREYTVTLELAGGTAPYELTYQVVDGASFTFPAAPTLDGFVFQGWKAENDPKLYLPGESVTVTADVTFTAQWAAFRPDMHRVILPEDGSVTAMPAAATEGAEILLRVQPKENYAVQAVLVRDAFGDAVAVTTRPDGTYSFLMPNSDATVTVVYRYGCDGGKDCPSIGFTDFDASRWYHEGIDFAVRHGLINGMEHNTVQPDTTLTRAMLVTMLYRYTAPEGTFENPFVDVPSGAWYTQAVAWAAENGIVKGVGDNKFEPDRSITREELVTVLYRYAQMLGRDIGAAAELSAYPDGSHVSPYAEAAMRWAVAEGIVNGKAVPGSTQIVLQPLGSATRAEVATMLMRFFGNE